MPKERKDRRLWSRGICATERTQKAAQLTGICATERSQKAAQLTGQLAGLVEESALGQWVICPCLHRAPWGGHVGADFFGLNLNKKIQNPSSHPPNYNGI